MTWPLYFLVALIPLIVGAIYYNPKVLGTAWQREAGVTDEQLQNGNMLKIFGLAYVFSIFVAISLSMLVIHQTALSGMFGMMPEFGQEGSELMNDLNALDEKYDMYSRHRHFGHGALHGGLVAIFFAGTLIAINALFERRSWKYILIHLGYWFIAMTLMGGILCQFLIL